MKDGPGVREQDRAAKLRERETRGQFFAEAKEHTPLVAARSADGAVYIVSTRRRGHAGLLFTKGASPEMRVLGEAMAILDELGLAGVTSGTFIDIGANIGTSTITALRAHGFRDAVACEPAPDSVRLLRMNLIANDLAERAQVIPAAVSDREGTARLALSPLSDCQNRVVEDEDTRTIDVESVTLDGLAAQGVFRPEDVGLLWIDAEGHEPHVLRGASALLERATTIVVEYHPALLGPDGVEALHDLLGGYRAHDLRGEARGKRRDIERPAALDELAERYVARDGASAHTDLLLVSAS